MSVVVPSGISRCFHVSFRKVSSEHFFLSFRCPNLGIFWPYLLGLAQLFYTLFSEFFNPLLHDPRFEPAFTSVLLSCASISIITTRPNYSTILYCSDTSTPYLSLNLYSPVQWVHNYFVCTAQFRHALFLLSQNLYYPTQELNSHSIHLILLSYFKHCFYWVWFFNTRPRNGTHN